MKYCFDLDGTLCTKRNLDYQNAEPFKERIEIVNSLYDEGHTIVIIDADVYIDDKGKNSEDYFKIGDY